MKVSIITTAPTFNECKRIQKELTDLGHIVNVVDLSNSGFKISDSHLTLPGLTDLDADVVIVRGVFQFIKELTPFIENYRSRGIKVFDNNLSHHQYAINKVVDLIKLGIAEIPTPKTSYARTFDDIRGFSKDFGFPFILKNTNKGKGAGVYKIDSEEKLEEIISKAEKEGKKAKGFIAQEFIDYVHDLRVLIIGEDVYAMKRIPPQGDFRANFSIGGTVELFDLSDKTKELAQRALKAMNMTVAGVDVLIDKEGNEYILEVNHTPGFTGMEKAKGDNIGKKFVQTALDKAF